MNCSTPLEYAVGLVLVFAFAFWLGRRWEIHRPQPKHEDRGQ